MLIERFYQGSKKKYTAEKIFTYVTESQLLAK